MQKHYLNQDRVLGFTYGYATKLRDRIFGIPGEVASDIASVVSGIASVFSWTGKALKNTSVYAHNLIHHPELAGQTSKNIINDIISTKDWYSGVESDLKNWDSSLAQGIRDFAKKTPIQQGEASADFSVDAGLTVAELWYLRPSMPSGLALGTLEVSLPVELNVARLGRTVQGEVKSWMLASSANDLTNTRLFSAIKPKWNAFEQITYGTIPPGTPMKMGTSGIQFIGKFPFILPGGNIEIRILNDAVENQNTFKLK